MGKSPEAGKNFSLDASPFIPVGQLPAAPWAVVNFDKGLSAVMDDDAELSRGLLMENQPVRAVKGGSMYITVITYMVSHTFTANRFFHSASLPVPSSCFISYLPDEPFQICR